MIDLNAAISGAVHRAAGDIIPPVQADVVQALSAAQKKLPHHAPTPPPATLDASTISQQIVQQVLADPQIARMATPLPWWQSQAMWGGIVAAASGVAGLFGVVVSADDQLALASGAHAIVTGALALTAAIGGFVAVIGRLTTTRQIRGS